MALLVDMALHNGVAPMTGKMVGIESGDPRTFKTFEELWQAYRAQAEFIVDRMNVLCHLAHGVDAERFRLPLWSCLVPGCMENGQDYIVGGQGTYKSWEWKDRGHVDAADSLTAIKALVFEQKKLTMDELLAALDSNFAGERGEEIHQMCLAVPKYGNGIEEIDKMVRESGKLMGELIFRHKNPLGGPYSINRHGLSWHYYGGKGVGALPNGHKAGEPLNDGSLSPMRGTDKNGITAVLRSAINAEFKESRIAVLNQKFPVSLMQSPESIDKLASLTQTFLTSGGSHIQYNILDHQKLLDAKKHPEQYKDLIVRVAGYSAYWVHLTPEIQDDIIARTQQGL
jgi:pyruvate-formate lyase